MDLTDCLAKGRDFHEQLFTLLGGPSHPDDDTHDLMVGTALVTAVEQADPARAAQAYNDWAQDHGYASIDWIGTFTTPDGRPHHWFDIRDAVICVSPDYRLRLLRGTPCQSGQA